LSDPPWDKSLRLKVIYEEKKQYNKLVRKKHRIFKHKLLQNLIESSDNNPTEFWKIVNLLKEKKCEDPSQNISPQGWYDSFNTLMNLKYDNNVNVKNICKYVDSNSDELNADITAEEVIKAVKSLKIKKKSCGFDCITNEMIKVYILIF
jgi:hypothetical protein